MSDAALARPAGRTRLRARLGVVLLVIGLLVAAVPGLVAGNAFFPRAWLRAGSFEIPLPLAGWSPGSTRPQMIDVSGDEIQVSSNGSRGRETITITGNASISITGAPFAPSRLTDLVLYEPGWTAAAIAVLLGVPLYIWWRRGGLSFGRAAGVAMCVAAAAAVCLLVLVPETDGPRGRGIWWTVPLGASLMATAFVVAPAPERRVDD